MEELLHQNNSKYLKPERETKMFYLVSIMFFFTLFVLPQYFGVPFPLFDLTALRIIIVILLIMIVADTKRKNNFVDLIVNSTFTKFLIPYLFVITYTMLLRVDVNAFLNPFIELLTLYLLIYIIKFELGIEKSVKLLIYFTYFLAIMGIIEFAFGRSLFSYLETIHGLYTGQFIRSGSYRIMGSSNHSLGYGLMLITMVPFSCIDVEKNELNLFRRPILLFLLIGNIFLCGSRSTLSVLIIEIIMLILLLPNLQKKRVILISGILLIVVVCGLLAGKNTSIGQYILLQITSIIDQLLGTKFSVQYGANLAALGSSSNYRDQLKYIFIVDWLNPLLGIGRKRSFSSEINGSFIASVDNFYIAEFVRYAYPGLVTYMLYIGYFIVYLFKRVKDQKFCIYRILFIGVICYLINLIWVDSLQTLKYLYILFALGTSYDLSVCKKNTGSSDCKSRYIKKGKQLWNH